MRKCIVFTDGSCPKNGKPDARATFAVLLSGGVFRNTIVRGEIEPFEYEYVNGSMIPTNKPCKPSNNRGELFGLIYAFIYLLKAPMTVPIEVVSDSKICLQTLLVYLPKRLEQNTEEELKNYDLVKIAYALYRQIPNIKLTHVNSHKKMPDASAPIREKLLHKGNDIVDRHAAAAFGEPIHVL